MTANEPAPRALACAACGTVFACTGDAACWCAAEPYRLPMLALQAAQDCLCPQCLRQAAAAAGQRA